MVLFAETPEATDFSHTLQKLAHPVTFGAIALLVMSLRRSAKTTGAERPSDYILAWGITVLLGAATEVGQIFTHRDPSVFDVLRDGLGGFAALVGRAAYVGRASGRGLTRAAQAFAAAVAVAIMFTPMVKCLVAYAHRDLQFPVLAQFRSPLDLYFFGHEKEDLLVTTPPNPWLAATDETVLSVPLVTARYDGIALREPFPDWRGYKQLLLDMTNPTDSDLRLTIRIHDRSHNQDFDDRFNSELLLPALTRTTTRFPLSDIESAPRTRRMNMRWVAGIVIFRAESARPQGFFLNKMWLE